MTFVMLKSSSVQQSSNQDNKFCPPKGRRRRRRISIKGVPSSTKEVGLLLSRIPIIPRASICNTDSDPQSKLENGLKKYARRKERYLLLAWHMA